MLRKPSHFFVDEEIEGETMPRAFLHYCIDGEFDGDHTASACGLLFSDEDAKTKLTLVASDVWCTNCIRWMKKRGILPGDSGKITKMDVYLDDEERAALDLMAIEANVTTMELLRQLIRRAMRDRESLLEPGQE